MKMLYLATLACVVICFLAFIYLQAKKKTYTRERYAFFSTLLIFSFTATVATHVFLDISLLGLIQYAFNTLQGIETPKTEASFSDKAWSAFFLVMLIVFVKDINNNWYKGGAISETDQESISRKRPLSLLRGALRGATPKKIPLAKDTAKKNKTSSDSLDFLDERLDWHSEAREILSIASQQYRIHKEDWHSEQNCYISKYANQNLLLICTIEEPDKDYIAKKIFYFKELEGSAPNRVIVSVREPLQKKKIEEINIAGTHVKITSKNEMLDSLADFSEYHAHLRKIFEDEEISEGDGIKLCDIYTECSGESTDLSTKETTKITNIREHLINWAENEPCGKHITLLGDYGQGKSVLSIKIALDLLCSGANARIPIIIELRGKSPRNETIEELVASWALQFSINVHAILKLLKEGRLLIILEGFDELDMVGNSHRRLEHFKRLWQFARYKKSKVIITGRPNLFLDNTEAIQYLHLNNDSSDIFRVEAIKIAPFQKHQIFEALRSVKESIRNEILALYERAGGNDGFSDLISRPSTLYQTSVIWDSLDKDAINSASVIEEFINHAYRRQTEKFRTSLKYGIQAPVLTAKERSYFMLGCAASMVKNSSYSNQIPREELHQVVSDLFYEIPEQASDDHDLAIPLQRRLADENDKVDSVFNDVRTSGILVRDLSKTNSFKLAHKSFLELLFAKFYVGLIQEGPNEVIFNSISKALGINKNLEGIELSEEIVTHIANLIEIESTKKNHRATLSESLINALNPWIVPVDKFFVSPIKGYGFIALIYAVVLMLNFSTRPLISLTYFQIFISFTITLIMIAHFQIMLRFVLFKKFKNPFRIWMSICKKLQIENEAQNVLSKPLQRILRLESQVINHGLLSAIIDLLASKSGFKSYRLDTSEAK